MIQTNNDVLAALMAKHAALKTAWGTLTGGWVPHDTWDQIRPAMGSENRDSGQFIVWLDITASEIQMNSSTLNCQVTGSQFPKPSP